MSDRDEILDLMRAAGFTRVQRGSQYNIERVERLVRLAQDAAYERAAAVCEKSDRYRGDYFAEKIRALKEVK